MQFDKVSKQRKNSPNCISIWSFPEAARIFASRGFDAFQSSSLYARKIAREFKIRHRFNLRGKRPR
jgi:hypothetical protein